MTRSPQPLLAIALLAVVLSVASRPAWSAWPHDPTVNLLLCTATGDRGNPQVVSDGAGGALVTWQDQRSGPGDIYVQRTRSGGTVEWTLDGAALCAATGDQLAPEIASDGAGGAIVTWIDNRGGNWDIYAQRISAAGTVQWTPDGVALCTASGDQLEPDIVSDGAGGAIVTWMDDRSGSGYDIYAQRISAAGAVQWPADGVATGTATSHQLYPNIVADGAGGALIAWQDLRSGNSDIYVQHVLSGGTVPWQAGGVPLCTASGNQNLPTIISDGAGGAVAGWADARGGVYDIYAQRISANGSILWAVNGVALCATTGNQDSPTIASDGAGGAIVTWSDYRGGGIDIYAQRVMADGAVPWTANGVALCTAYGAQEQPNVVSDGAGGAIVTWLDARIASYDIYAQRISAGGAVHWPANGVAVCTAAGFQQFPAIVADGACGAIVTWSDYHNVDGAIYAQRVDEWGYLGAEPAIASVRDVPNDQGGQVKVSWSASPLDTDPLFRNIDSYLVFRSVPPNQAARAIQGGAMLVPGPGEVVDEPGRLLVTMSGDRTNYWEYVGTQRAYHLPNYSMVAPTTGDSIPGSNPYTAFLVQAWTADAASWWSSEPDSGYSVDNLTPPAPAPFTGDYAAGTATLHWAVNPAPDLGEYRLYRGSTAAFVPGPENLVVAQPDTGYVDAAGSLCYYKLCAADVHENVSGFTLLLPSGASDVSGPALPSAVFLASPAPNPAHGATAVRFGLPREAHVELALYDQQGRRVRLLLNGTLPAGARTHTWDGCDESGHALPAGMYFVRLATEGRTLVSRLAVIR